MEEGRCGGRGGETLRILQFRLTEIDDVLGTNAITRALAPTPDSQDEALLRRISAPAEREQGAGERADADDGGAESESGGEEQAVESADLDEGTCEGRMKLFA